MTDEREKNLPKWAQELITELRQRVQYGNEPLLKEIAQLRPRVQLLEARYGAMMELLECAAKGGHSDSNFVIHTLEGYGLELSKEGETK